jgi:hypothetical protein
MSASARKFSSRDRTAFVVSEWKRTAETIEEGDRKVDIREAAHRHLISTRAAICCGLLTLPGLVAGSDSPTACQAAEIA